MLNTLKQKLNDEWLGRIPSLRNAAVRGRA